MANGVKLILMDNISELGQNVDKELKKMLPDEKFCALKLKNERFSNGEGKGSVTGHINGQSVFVMTDVGNYGQKYSFRDTDHIMSPDEHYQDVKRVISALGGRAQDVTLIMPLLYQSRQDKRSTVYESLDCAVALQELELLGVDRVVSFDIHNPGIVNAVPNLPFSNLFPTDLIVKKILSSEEDFDKDNTIIVAPDTGAMNRAKHYAERVGCDVGLFYKRRDYKVVKDGKNPVVEHVYLGKNPEGLNIIIVDDMIASGSSVLESAKYLRSRGANNVIVVATFALFTDGPNSFDKAYSQNIINKVYSTNLTYVPKEIKSKPWYVDVDCSSQIATIIKKLYIGD